MTGCHAASRGSGELLCTWARDHHIDATGGGGVAGTVDLLRRSLRPGGTMLIGEAYWRREPPDQDTVAGCDAIGADGFRVLPELLEQFRELGCDVVEMILADQDNWDRYVAAQWLNTRR
jgi:hypothetical protein